MLSTRNVPRCAGRRPESDLTAIEVLRKSTKHAHAQLEAGIGLLEPDLDVTHYVSLLRGFASLHQTLDSEIHGQLAYTRDAAIVELDFGSRRKLPSLQSDIEVLGASLPQPVQFRISSLAGALGALYVCEGATLGGRIIGPHVSAVLGPDIPVTFFDSYGADVPRMWSICCRVINELLPSRSDKAEACAVAVALFEHFEGVLL
jgi:heme oxygenase